MEEAVIGIKSTFDDSGTDEAIRKLAKVNLATKALGRSQAEATRSSSRMSMKMSELDGRFNRLQKTLDKQTRILRMGLMPALKVVTTGITALTAALAPAVVGLAGFVAALAGAKLTLAAVNVGTKAWTLALKGMAAGAAVALGAISMLSAAMSELKATAAAPFVGQTSRQTQGIWGSLIGDPKIAALGVDNIQSASAALMKMKVPVGDLNKYLKELGDYGFYAGGGDAGAGLSQIILAMKALGKGSMTGDSLKTFAASFGEMGPAIEQAGKAFVGKDTQKFIDFLMSNPEQLKAFSSGLDELNNTLMGTLKTFRPVLQGALEPFGSTLNDVAKGPLAGFRDFLVDLVRDVMPSVVLFLGERLPGVIARLQTFLTGLADKFKEVIFTVDPENDGFGGKVTGFFDQIQSGWQKAKPVLEQLARGWDVIYKFMEPIIKAVGGMFGRIVMGGAKGLESTADKWAAAGEAIANYFRPGGPVEQSLKVIWDFVSVVGKALGPGLKDIIIALKSPLYILAEISRHPDALKKIGDGLGRVARGLGPIFELIANVIGHLIEVMPSVVDTIADVFEFVGRLASAIQPVVDAFLSIASSVGAIKVLILWMISKAVLSRMALLFGGLSGGRIGGAMAGASPATLAGLGLLTYGIGTGGGSASGVAASIAGGAAIGSSFGPLGTVIGAGAGYIAMEAINPAKAGEGDATQEDAAKIEAILSKAPKSNYELYSGWTNDRRQSIYKQGNESSLTDGGIVALQTAVNSIDKASVSVQTNLIKIGIGVAKAGETLGEGWANYENIARLADDAGVSLANGAYTMEDGIKMLETAASRLKPAGQLMSESLNKYIFQPIEDREYVDYLSTAATNIIEQIAQSGFDPSIVETYALPVIQKYQAMIESGAMSIGDGAKATVEDLTSLQEQLYLSGQGDATIRVGELITQYQTAATEAQTLADKQQEEFTRLAQGLADAVSGELSTIVGGMSSGVGNVLAQLRSLSSLRITVSPDGRILVTGGSVTRGGSPTSPTPGGSGLQNDTNSPRFNMLNTQRVHAMVDGGITGKRSVTSMWRNHGLGSSNSDHVTGRALDVTGQNLGAYATSIRRMGGFAEFHGTDSNRHLHVVPPSLPVGDRPSPRPPMNGSHQPQVSQTVQTTVYAQGQMNEEMLARKIASKNASMMRNMAERS